MPMLVSQRDQDAAVSAAASSPYNGASPGFTDRFLAEQNAQVQARNADAREASRFAQQQDYIRRFYAVSGQRLPNWLGGAGVNPVTAREEAARAQVGAWKKANPDSDFPDMPTNEEIEAEWERTAKASVQNARSLESKSYGASAWIGGFLGTAVGAMRDPINIMALPFGAARSAGWLATVGTEALVGAASESLIQGINYNTRRRVDPDYSVGDALTEIGASGVGAGAIAGTLKGLAGAWHRLETGEWPSHVRDAANIVTREAAVPASRFEQSATGEAVHRASLAKAADDLSTGRPVELPPEAYLEANARPGRVYDADGNSVGVRYEVVEADDLITSHRDDLGVNPDFPQELQPRDRTRAMSQDQITGIAANLQPERLGFSTDAANGAPIIGPDGLVESGNGRVLALRRAFQQDGPQANSYRNYLRSQNFDIEGMRNPVLIARRVTDLEDRVAFVTAANRSTAMRLGAAEQALSDARMLDGAALDRLAGSDLASAENQAFTRSFMSKLPRAEQGSLIDADGRLSQEGHRRITAALMGRAYGEPALLGRALEDTDNNIKGIAGALADSSGSWAKMRDAVARGEIPAGMDITSDLMNAVRLVMKARDEGRAMRDLVNQAEMFGGPDELSKIVARAMFSDIDLKRPVGRAKLAAFLDDFASESMKNEAGPRLFGDALDAPDILKSSLERVGRSDLGRIADERLTQDALDALAEAPETMEVAIMDAQRLRAERGDMNVNLGDEFGERSLGDILDEADDEIAAAKEIEACALGRELTE